MFASITPLGRIGQPEEMFKAILFLASADSSYTTGIDLVADGGMTQVQNMIIQIQFVYGKSNCCEV